MNAITFSNEEKDALKEEYDRIVENKKIYSEEMGSKEKIQQIIIYFWLFLIFIIMWAISTLPTGTTVAEDVSTHPLSVWTFFVGFGLLISTMVVVFFISNKVSKISRELDLSTEEQFYLNTYETHENIEAFLEESNPRRKLYFKKQALENVRKMMRIVKKWRYGHIPLISKLVGNQIDLIKDNMRRLVLSNVAEGDETTLKKVSDILIGLCKYIYSPSIEELNELNDVIAKLPFKEYEHLTRKGRLCEYFYNKPRTSRLLFAFGIATSISVVMYFSAQNIGATGAVGVTSFWGAFAGFDKIFNLKKE